MGRLANRKLILAAVFTVFLMGAVADPAKPVYPLRTNVTLNYWMDLHANVALIAKNFGETVFARELQKRVGVKINYLHPASGQAAEAFNLMLASGDLPDIIEYKWFDVPGGPNNAINNGYILRLNPLIDKYAPNLKKFLMGHPEYDRMVKTDEGNYYVFPFIRGDATLLFTAGPVIRKDWLDELGLAVPETIDEWYTVLKAFKEKKKCPAPLTLPREKVSAGYAGSYPYINQLFAGAFNNTNEFYVEKGKVKYGGIEPQRKLFLAEMNKWYREGLLDPDFATTDRKTVDANMLSGRSGACQGSGGSGIGRYMQAMAGKEPKSFNLVAAPYPGPKKGVMSKFAVQSPLYGRGNNGSAAISAKCKYPEAAVRLLDYAYGEEGNMLYNFGILGASYTMIDGYPTYTKLIMRNPGKLPVTTIMSKYMRAHTNGPFVQDKRYLEQYYELPQQKEALKIWSKTGVLQYMLPPVTPTKEESAELARIMNEIIAYTDEMTLKYIMGVEPLDTFDQYVAQVKKMGIGRAIELNQAALARYLKRK
ncbi:MAG: extracellular solute-binding protein [Firmicutes bacterium]|nr:extracellular solute-binding protein [Bacillota bacterium]